ncbi:sensor histidine kinase [Leifsonia sp. NPDC058230]|uniref:sensor histidine kinase n=1 Tax=Leifsonia sp. NPDC058230 TaxID=3346391 RepID=UPI0036DC0E0F
MTSERITGVAVTVASGLARSTTFALCGLIVPFGIALLPLLAALHAVGSPWSWSNPWSWVGSAIIGAILTLALAHPVAVLFRRLIARWSGTSIPSGFLAQPEPVRLSTGFWWNGSAYERTREDAQSDLRLRRLREPAYWREVRWVVIAAVVVAPLCSVPATAMVGAIVLFAFATPLSIGSGVALAAVSLVSAPWAWHIVRPVANRWLATPDSPDGSVEDLRMQRADLSAAHDAEIRRIERDLHDGAQARLVAVGLDLATAERLIETDPERAVAMLRAARAGTAESLKELRGLVHGVYPPVLIERGLVPAIRALALDGPLETVVDGPDDLRLPAPLAAAVYFSLSELLANAAKHANARIARVAVTRGAGCIYAVVHDDGAGGAAMRPGGGLDGVRRRLAAFDGTIEIDSPTGGPTMLTVMVPCESS